MILLLQFFLAHILGDFFLHLTGILTNHLLNMF